PSISRFVRGTAKRLQARFLVVQQMARAGAREIPVAPIAALEPVALGEQPRRDGALRSSVKPRERLHQQWDGIGAQRRGIPAVERAFGGRAREVGTDEEGIGI